MSATHPDCMADLERMYDGPIPRAERERVRKLERTKSWALEVQTAGSGDSWDGNDLRFARKEDAEAWVADLSTRWTAVRETRVIPSNDEPNT
jgi:hypothetical protein